MRNDDLIIDHGPGTCWTESEIERLILTEDGRHSDLEHVAGVG
jgi:hypothetical protein